MTGDDAQRSWIALEDLINEGNPEDIDNFLDALSPAETALAVSRLDESTRVALVGLLRREDVAEMLVDLTDEQAADLMEEIPAQAAAEIVGQLPEDEQADLLGSMGSDEAEAILESMSSQAAVRARELLQYPEDTAGGLMSAQYLAYPESNTVTQAVADLRAHSETYSDYQVQYLYVVSGQRRLLGVLRMRDLLLSRGKPRLDQIMIAEPISVHTSLPLDKLKGIFEQHASFIALPVTDHRSRLQGIVRRATVMEAAEKQAERSFLRLSGIVGGEEYRSMPATRRAFRRLSWLAPNIVLNIIAASVIAFYQNTLQAVIALAVFLPIISDMSGCSGNQAVAVSIRELALGLIRPTEFLRVFMKEAWVGIMNGLILGVLLGSVAYLWKSSVVLSLVVGAALALNTLLSVLLGGSVPLLLRRFGVDPALASGPILTTVTDMCGFFFVLSFASAWLPQL